PTGTWRVTSGGANLDLDAIPHVRAQAGGRLRRTAATIRAAPIRITITGHRSCQSMSMYWSIRNQAPRPTRMTPNTIPALPGSGAFQVWPAPPDGGVQ